MSQYITALRYNKTEAKFTSHYIHKSFLMQFSINDNDVSAGKTTESATLFIYVAMAFVLELRLQCDNHLPKYLIHCTVFWLKWPIDDLLLVIPPPPLIKVSSITRSCSKLGKNNFEWKGEGRIVLYLTDL